MNDNTISKIEPITLSNEEGVSYKGTFSTYNIVVIRDLKPSDVICWEVPVDADGTLSMELDKAYSVHQELQKLFPNNQVITIPGKISIKENQ